MFGSATHTSDEQHVSTGLMWNQPPSSEEPGQKVLQALELELCLWMWMFAIGVVSLQSTLRFFRTDNNNNHHHHVPKCINSHPTAAEEASRINQMLPAAYLKTPAGENITLLHFKCNYFLVWWGKYIWHAEMSSTQRAAWFLRVFLTMQSCPCIYWTFTAAIAPSFLIESAGGSVKRLKVHFKRRSRHFRRVEHPCWWAAIMDLLPFSAVVFAVTANYLQSSG